MQRITLRKRFFIGESTAGESRHGLNGIVLAGEGNIMYSIHVYIYIC